MRNLLVLLFAILTSPLFGASADGGTADLSSWDGRSPVTLDGTWRFWPRSAADSGPGTPLEVPGTWSSALGGADGWGTYRLSVVLPDPPPADLALSLPVIASAAEVRWNGRKVWSVGTWAPEQGAYVPDRRSAVVPLEPAPGTHVLEIRASNWGDLHGGLTDPPKLGSLAGLTAARAAEVNWSVFLFGGLLLMGFYNAGLFLYRPRDRAPLWFALLAVLLGLRGLVYGPAALADFLPGLDWSAQMRLGYLTFSAPTLLFGLFLCDLFPSLAPRWFLPAVLAGAGGYTLAVLFLPPAWFSPVLPAFQAFAAAEGLVLAGLLLIAALQGRRGARPILVGFVLFFLTAVNDILKSSFFLPTPDLASAGLVVFLVFQSLVLLAQFTAALEASETYNRNLTRINTALGRFIPGAVLGFLDKESVADIELGDHCEQSMAVLFADIRDFTRLSETMSPEENFRFINSYLRRMGPVVRRHEGFVDKYLGDGILALFPGEPRQVLEAALDLRRALDEYNGHRAKSGYPAIRMGIGIHWGPLMLGTIGENERMDSTVISDTVNAASRLEGLTKKFGRDILVSEETLDALGPGGAQAFDLEYLDEETVKGRTRPLRVYALKAAV